MKIFNTKEKRLEHAIDCLCPFKPLRRYGPGMHPVLSIVLVPYTTFKRMSIVERFKYTLIKEGFDVREEDGTVMGFVKEKRPVFFNLFSRQVDVYYKIPARFVTISWGG